MINDTYGYLNTGYDFQDRLDYIQSQLDSRCAILNSSLQKIVNYQVLKFKDTEKFISKLQEQNLFYEWYVNVPIYKKFWYSITKKDLKKIYKSQLKTRTNGRKNI